MVKLFGMDIPTQLELADHGIVHIPEHKVSRFGKLWIAHGHELGLKSGTVNIARQVRMRVGVNVIFGHWHKSQVDTSRNLSARIRVDGSSMEPTLHSGEFMIVNKLAYKLGSPQIGDVVVFHFPGNPEQEYIKRIIGLPGDCVDVANGTVSVNGQALNEPYIAAPPAMRKD